MSEQQHPRLPIIIRTMNAALKSGTKNIIKIGGLLAEAKELATDHGTWLPWLRDNFAMSE
jgi:hypothetical protein